MFDFPASPSNGQIYSPPGGPVYSWDGVAWVSKSEGVGDIAIIDRYFTASGTYTRPSGLLMAEVWVQAAGGGGGTVTGTASSPNAGCGGGGGGCAYKLYQANQLPASVAFTVGTGGGPGGSPNGVGQQGGSSTFDTMSATGGNGGSWTGTTTTLAYSYVGAAGGAATGGDLNIAGSPGGMAYSGVTGSALSTSGHGGTAGCGAGGAVGKQGAGAAGNVGSNGINGSGASGGACGTIAATYTGGTGGNGFVRVREHYGKLGSPIIASKRTVITATTSTFQYDALTVYADIEVVGGGGGGGGSTGTPTAGNAGVGGGGGAGAYCKKLIAITDAIRAATKTITIGAAGAAAGNGGASSYADGVNTLTAGGGLAGTSGAVNTSVTHRYGGGAVAATGGDLNVTSSVGQSGTASGANSNGAGYSAAAGGNGAAGPWGGCGVGAVGAVSNSNASGNGTAGTGYGSGGGGGFVQNAGSHGIGGIGAPGVVIITEYSGQPPVAAAVIADAPTDGNEYTRVNGIWRLKEQTLTWAGTSQLDIPVPTGAKLAHIEGSVWTPASVTYLLLRVSSDGTTFLSGASDYGYSGPAHASGSSAYGAGLAAGASSALFISTGHDHGNLPQTFTIDMAVSRPAGASDIYQMKSTCRSYYSPASSLNLTQWYGGYVNGTVADQLKALRLLLNGPVNARTGTVNVRWIY